MSLYQRRGIKFLCIVLAIALVFGVWQLSSLFWLNIFNVRTTVEDYPPGVTQAIVNWLWPEAPDGAGSGPGGTEDKEPESGPGGTEDKEPQAEPKGSNSPLGLILTIGQGNLIWVNTDIDYGYVFPGEILTDNFTVHLKTWVTGTVTYTVNMTNVGGYMEMRKHLIIVRDPAEDPEPEPDSTANGTALDYMATGNLTAGADTFDKWYVTFYVPSENGTYQTNIEIIPEDKTQLTPP